MDKLIFIGENLFLAIIGLLIYSLYQAKKYVGPNAGWSTKLFFTKNKSFWLWSLTMQFLFVILLAFYPDVTDIIKEMTTLDLSKKQAFLISGAQLSHIAKLSTNKK